MPGRAFIPGPLSQAQPRVYKSFRGRQLKGIGLAAAGGLAGLLLFGTGGVVGYAMTFALALPGFAYGWFQPEGKPVEYWLHVLLRYYLSPQQFGAIRVAPRWRRLTGRVGLVLRAALRARRMARRQRTRRLV